MANKPLVNNAKEALNQMKLEIAGDFGIPNNHVDGANKTSYENGLMAGSIGAMMTKKLVKMGEEQLLREYNSKKI
ncbi:Small [[Clostridium] sordellii]|uniref:alpha/beta-type small acid-soluble spore protein n=1 Tax=Paraclostridium sordellii TaxID=1505 RepID=UPI0005DC7013|nr:alpha/beta-type small acid-soluble spore protein [Paeniclostridium sordellii]CEQ22445.1 Small [[Clostridium] sordellii] [Paeniclostridium sordellii]